MPSRPSEQPRLRLDGAGEGAALVAEQLALEQRLDSATQLRRRSGRLARGEALWIDSASTSLPAPVSPRRRMLIGPFATRSASS